MTIKELIDVAINNGAIYYKLYTVEDLIDLTRQVRHLYDLNISNMINLTPNQIEYIRDEKVNLLGMTDEDSVFLFVNEEFNNAILGIVKKHRGISWAK